MKITHETDYKPTPEELAEAWWEMDAKEQAKFFNQLGEHIDKNTAWDFSMQLQYVTDEPRLNRLGREAMKAIGDYSEPSK